MRTKVYPILNKTDFPTGVTCPECMNIIMPGQPYDEKTIGRSPDTLTVEIWCVYH